MGWTERGVKVGERAPPDPFCTSEMIRRSLERGEVVLRATDIGMRATDARSILAKRFEVMLARCYMLALRVLRCREIVQRARDLVAVPGLAIRGERALVHRNRFAMPAELVE